MNTKPNASHLLARLPIGMSMLSHGIDRMPKLQAFTDHITGQFDKTFLPLSLVAFFSHVLPFLELLIGILLLSGLFTRFGCILGVLLMTALIFGSSLLEQWENVFTQVVYGAYFALLFCYAMYNHYSIDAFLAAGSTRGFTL
jgi:thiosulfate dehydrogenase (quinone) large subunit